MLRFSAFYYLLDDPTNYHLASIRTQDICGVHTHLLIALYVDAEANQQFAAHDQRPLDLRNHPFLAS